MNKMFPQIAAGFKPLLLGALVLLFGLLANSANLHAQQKCVVVSSENPITADPNAPMPTTVRYVAVAIRIVRQSNGTGGIAQADVNTALANLNTAFAPAMIGFYIVDTDYIDNDIYYGIDSLREFIDLYQTNREPNAINLYFVQSIYNSTAGIAAGVPSFDAAVRNTYATTTVLTHEMGHCLGLFHTHGGGT